MAKSIDTAVILAAGLGSRLGDLKENKPKAFVKVGGVTLIDRSIQSLIDRGISRIIIGTGYLNEAFDELADRYPQVITLKNPIYDKTGSMYTLYVLQELIRGPFLLLEGDLLYESAALKFVMGDEKENIILASDATHSGDEVFIQSNNEGLLEKMDKDKSKLTHINGELVGISKLTLTALKGMVSYAQRQYDDNNYQLHYEDAMVGIANEIDLTVKVVEDMAWCEIDDPSHLQRAISVVYPKILNRSMQE
ncbi:MAG: phosphocholine cytidylyltransferase family protein [Cyclobacteriaceae bacterium]